MKNSFQGWFSIEDSCHNEEKSECDIRSELWDCMSNNELNTFFAHCLQVIVSRQDRITINASQRISRKQLQRGIVFRLYQKKHTINLNILKTHLLLCPEAAILQLLSAMISEYKRREILLERSTSCGLKSFLASLIDPHRPRDDRSPDARLNFS